MSLECKKELLSQNDLNRLIGQLEDDFYQRHWGKTLIVIYGDVETILLRRLESYIKRNLLRDMSGYKVDVYVNGIFQKRIKEQQIREEY